MPATRTRRETKVRRALGLVTSLSWGRLSQAATVPPGTQASVSVGSLHSYRHRDSSNPHGPHVAILRVRSLGGWTDPPLRGVGEAVRAGGSGRAPSDDRTPQPPEAAPSTLAEVMKEASYPTSRGCARNANASQCN